MIVTEYYQTRQDGVRLERTYSDAGVMIRNTTTDALYTEVINPEDSGRTYEETNIPIPVDDPPDNLEEAARFLVQSRTIVIPEEEEPDYLNEHESESDYFN